MAYAAAKKFFSYLKVVRKKHSCVEFWSGFMKWESWKIVKPFMWITVTNMHVNVVAT